MASATSPRFERRRGGVLVSRCAWCDRVRVGGTWIRDRRTPVPLKLATHSICPTCMTELRDDGSSR